MPHQIETHLLKDNETIIMILRRHWIILVFKAFYICILIISSIVIMAFQDAITSLIDVRLFWATLCLYWISFILFIFLSWVNHELDLFVVTNERVIGVDQTGALSRNVTECSLDRVQEVRSTVSGIFPTIFWYGEVHLTTASETSNMTIEYAPHPVDSVRKINTIIQEFRWRQQKNVI